MSEAHVVIVANGGANIASLQYALERLNVPSRVSAEPETIRAATHVILPGVGAAGDAMMRLRRAHLHELLPTLRQPVLGICLGIIPGRATRFAEAPGRRVPHIGWNTVDTLRDSALLAGLKAGDYAYFVHSYALPVSRATVASTCYGAPFTACVEWGNFYGAQFHPERSAAVGARVLKNFLAIH